MDFDKNTDKLVRGQLSELLLGGFAPVIVLLREYHYDKTGIVLNGLPFSAWSLLEHMRHRKQSCFNL